MTTTDRDEAIRTIRTELRRRSGRPWSVTGGRGTSWGWITITAPPARRNGGSARRNGGSMTPQDQDDLSALLGEHVHDQGALIPASSDYRREYVERASGRVPAVTGRPYWD